MKLHYSWNCLSSSLATGRWIGIKFYRVNTTKVSKRKEKHHVKIELFMSRRSKGSARSQQIAISGKYGGVVCHPRGGGFIAATSAFFEGKIEAVRILIRCHSQLKVNIWKRLSIASAFCITLLAIWYFAIKDCVHAAPSPVVKEVQILYFHCAPGEW